MTISLVKVFSVNSFASFPPEEQPSWIPESEKNRVGLQEKVFHSTPFL